MLICRSLLWKRLAAMVTRCLFYVFCRLSLAVLVLTVLQLVVASGSASALEAEQPFSVRGVDNNSTEFEENATASSTGSISTSDGYSSWLRGGNAGPGPKTLMSWNGAETDDHKPNPKLVTDRPHFSEASSLVGLGRVQIETGYSIFSDRSNGIRTITQSFGEPLLRAGVGAEWFEFRLATTALTESVSAAGNSRFAAGVDDIYIGAKLAITEQAGALPEFAIFPQARLPSGSSAFTSDRFLPGVNLAYSWMLNDWIELECNTQFNNRRDDLFHTYTEFIQTANVEYELAEALGGFTEIIAFIPSGSLSALPEYYFHAGLVMFPNDDVQFDMHAGVGLNAPAANLAFTGVGLSWRY
ncbi:MAG: hypothetical protein JWN70_5733 [Planctomycetaceae bacterium]|nr:hypothetical protein [Planctomycetaceae bacterium]